MEISSGCIVTATAGRDSGKLFAVISIENGFADIVDGKGRRVEKPKHKKLKHLKLIYPAEMLYEKSERTADKLITGAQVTNSEVRKLLFSIRSEISDTEVADELA